MKNAENRFLTGAAQNRRAENRFLTGAAQLIGLLAVLCAPAYGSVTITSLTPSVASPQPLGTSITWTATATGTGKGAVTFQFNIAPPNGSLAMVSDFNVGSLSSGVWTSQPFTWVPTAMEGAYQVEVVAKNFKTGASGSKTASFIVKPLVTGGAPVVTATANALVALFSAPACPAGSQMRVSFQQQSGATPATTTSWANCIPGVSMNFEIAGMYAQTAYTMFSQTKTNGNIVNGPAVLFTTGAIPKDLAIPTYKIEVPAGASTDTADSVILINTTQLNGGRLYPNLAIDLSGNVLWYYSASSNHGSTITRPLSNGTVLTVQYGKAWTTTKNQQLLVQIDLAGNVVRETNTGAVQRNSRPWAPWMEDRARPSPVRRLSDRAAWTLSATTPFSSILERISTPRF